MNYKVSVSVMTFNRDKFVAQAIQSVLDQKTNFKVELVIGDDGSTDNTLNIVHSFKNTDNVTIRILDRPKSSRYHTTPRKYRIPHNFADIVKHCKGQYIAMLDGDDYWADPLKLQKQADFLDAQQNYIACFHNATLLFEDGATHRYITDEYLASVYPEFPCVNDLIKRNFIPSPSPMFRNKNIKFATCYYDCPFQDWPFYFMLMDRGKVKFINEVMAVYRVHKEAAWSGLSKEAQSLQCIQALKIGNKLLKRKYTKQFCDAITMHYNELIKEIGTTDKVLSEHYSLELASFLKPVKMRLIERLLKVVYRE